MANRIDVFISSTSRDLKKYRAKVKEAVLTLGLFPIAMEEFQPGKENALQKCYDELQQAEVFVGIYAHRYGYAPADHHSYVTADGEMRCGDGETSITHLEYLWAVERGLPIYLFVLADRDDDDEPVAWPLEYVELEPERSRLKAFKNHIMDQHVVKFFHSVDDLATKVTAALATVRMPSPNSEFEKGRRSDFYQHVYLPPHYVPRPDLLDELRLILLGDGDVALTSAVHSVRALHGMGGIGKSVMARSLCEDPAVQAAFPDGILWAELGSEPSDSDIRTKLREWIEALGGVVSEINPTHDQLKANLTTLLQDRACLLIVDDVWQRRHAEHFQAGGRRCRLLITTRDAEVARSLGAEPSAVPTMTESEAIDLLRQWSGSGLADTDFVMLLTIVNKLGRLPLALKLAGAQLQKGDSQRWLQRFNARKLKAKRPEGDIHDSLEQTFGLSLEALSAVQRHLYAALAIFKEDEPIREMAIHRLWLQLGDLDEEESEELLDDLGARALLEIAGERYPRAAILHDLLRDFMQDELGDARSAHQALLEAYAASCEHHADWSTAPDDGYLYEHLVYHLQAAGETAAVRGLFADQRWMQVRVPAEGFRYDGYLADLAVYWNDAERRTLGGDIDALAEVMRCALIHTSPNMLAGNLPPMLIARAVTLGYWSIDRALSLVRRIPRTDYRHEMYVALLQAHLIPEPYYDEVVRQAIEVANERLVDERNPSMLMDLAPFIPAGRYSEIYTDCLEITRQETNPETRARLLFQLASLLQDQRGQLQHEALAAAAKISNAKDRVEILTRYADELFEVERSAALQRADEAAATLTDEYERLSMLARIATLLPAEALADRLPVILGEIRGSDSSFVRSRVLLDMIPLIPELERSTVITEVLVAARLIDNPHSRIRALMASVQYLPLEQHEVLLKESLEVVRGLQNVNQECILLSEIAREGLPWLAPEARGLVIQETFRIAEEVSNYAIRAIPLYEVIPYMNDTHSAQALSLVKRSEDGYYLRRGLDLIAPLLSVDQLRAAFAVAYSIDYEGENSGVISGILERLSPDLHARALVAARSVSKREIRLRALTDLAEYFDGAERDQILDDALRTARGFTHSEHVVRRLIALLPLASSEKRAAVLAEALVILQGISDGGTRIRQLLELIEFVPRDERKPILEQARHDALQIGNPVLRLRILIELKPYLDESDQAALFTEMLDVAQAAEEIDKRLDAWRLVLPHTPAELLEDLITRALDESRQVADPRTRVEKLVRMAEMLPIDERQEIISQCRLDVPSIKGNINQIRALFRIAQIAPSDQTGDILTPALNLVLSLEDEGLQVRLLSEIAPLLPSELLSVMVWELLRQAEQMNDASVGIALLMAVVSNVTPELRAQVIAKILDFSEQIVIPEAYTRSLLPVVPLLATDQRPAVLSRLLDSARRSDNAEDRVTILCELLEYLPERHDAIIEESRAALLMHLREISHHKRARVMYLSHKEYWSAPVLSETCMRESARHILEIAFEWEWL